MTFASIFIVFFALAGYLDSQGTLFQVIGMGGSAFYILLLLATLDVKDTRSCQAAFLVGTVTKASIPL